MDPNKSTSMLIIVTIKKIISKLLLQISRLFVVTTSSLLLVDDVVVTSFRFVAGAPQSELGAHVALGARVGLRRDAPGWLTTSCCHCSQR